MAEIVVSAVVTVLIEKLLAGDFMKFARSQGIDSQLKKWNTTLPMIKAVLDDAAQKQITQKLVELWMVELQDLVFDIEDVLDDIATEVMKRNLQESDGSTSSSSKVLKMIPTCTTSYTPHKIMYGRKMRSKLDGITTRLHDLFELSVSLGLNRNGETSAKINKRVEETSLLSDASEILGRQGDKDALLEKLLGDEGASSNQNVISIVSIVGMGGLGKTTLARLLYNDQKVKDHFKLRAWICVSDDFDVFNISKKIYHAVGGYKQDLDTLDRLHVALKEELSKKRFLLVLDDVWNEDHEKWETLKRPLVGAPGSKVIVTTRNTMVASVMKSVQPHNLGVLSDEIAVSLFARYALEEQNFDKHPWLFMIARGIVEKCGGLPLALVTIGRVLKTKGNDVVEWEALLNSEIWSSQDESGILPALKLSYYHLPSHLKQLFAYCSLYPKDHQFDKNKLVLKWMAQGFLSHTKGIKSMEILGHGYFEELRLRCFFQPSTNDKSRYAMHDLMNDLAKSVAGKFFFMLDDKVDTNGQNEDFEKFRHFSFAGQQHQEYRKLKELHRARCLRTFLDIRQGGFIILDNVLVKLLTRLQFLRVLSLTEYSITKVPQSIGNLKHLRYLEFSSTSIKHLPKQVGKLYNLQSLLVCDCYELYSLPRSLVKLKNLRHLDLAGTPLLKTPLGIGHLTSLQTLREVYIEGGDGFKISELKGLSNLQGSLSIKRIENVMHSDEAKDANLQQKKGLDDLQLEWSSLFNDSRDPVIEYEVLERLRPPSKLKKLSISFYGGMIFPSWLGNPTSFDQLTEITLTGCDNCTDLMLGHLSSLRKLCLSSMKAVQTMELLAPAKPFHGDAFPSLESLEIHDMRSLEIWSTSYGDDVETPQSFPSLRAISIKRCPKLGKVSIGLMPSLESLEVIDMQSLEIWSTSGGDDYDTPQSFPSLRIISFTGCPKLGKVLFGLIPSLKDLTIEGCSEAVLRDLAGVSSSKICRLQLNAIKGLTHLVREVLRHLAVEELIIRGCDELRYLWESELEACSFLGSLKYLYVSNCSKLESINKGEKEVVNVGSSIIGSLRQVKLWNCDSLESYCCPNSVEWLDIQNCSSMTSLSFSKLQREEDLPSSSSSSSSSNLKFLTIFNCKNIRSISQEHLQSLTSLEYMDVTNCPSMEDSFPSRGLLWPPNLKYLEIGELKKPMSEWGLLDYPPSLVGLTLYGKDSGVVSFGIIMEDHSNNTTTASSSARFLLPPSLTSLSIREFEEVESLSEEVLQHLPHLQYLYIGGCPKLKDNAPKTTSSLRVLVL